MDNPYEPQFSFKPWKFASHEYALKYAHNFDKFIELRIRGVPREEAIIEAFAMLVNQADLSNVRLLAMAAEHNPYYQTNFQLRVAEASVTSLWTQAESVVQLLQMAKDSSVRDATRLNAIAHLNVMCGYVVLDPASATGRVDKTLRHFKQLHADWVASESPTAPDATRH